MKNYYKIMGVRPSATDAEIKQVYRQRAKLLHPDLNHDNPTAADQLMELNEAYEVLSDPKKREEYNKQYNQAVLGRSARVQQTPPPQPGGAGAAYAQYRAGYASRFDAARAMAQAQAMAAQAAQAQQHRQVENAVKQSYNDGYAKGYSDAGVRIKELETRYSTDTAAQAARIKQLEEELAAADRDMAAQTQKLADMIAADEEAKKEENKKTAEEEKQAEFFKCEAETANVKLETAEKKLKETEKKVKEAEKKLSEKEAELKEVSAAKAELENKTAAMKERIALLDGEILDLKTKIAEFEEYIQRQDANSDIERIQVERTIKLKEYKKEYKNTYYSALGVNFWDSDEEIAAHYEKLKNRYENKAAKDDEKAKQKLATLEEAYAAVGDKQKRAEYDESIGVTKEAVERERALEKEYNDILDRYNREQEEQEFLEYVEELTLSAEDGDAVAQNELGEMYYYGEELVNDYEQAVYWFKEAAKQQNPDALFNLGNCFLGGTGVDKDDNAGIGFIKQAAKLGCAAAEKFLAKNK